MSINRAKQLVVLVGVVTLSGCQYGVLVMPLCGTPLTPSEFCEYPISECTNVGITQGEYALRSPYLTLEVDLVSSCSDTQRLEFGNVVESETATLVGKLQAFKTADVTGNSVETLNIEWRLEDGFASDVYSRSGIGQKGSRALRRRYSKEEIYVEFSVRHANSKENAATIPLLFVDDRQER